MADLYLQALLQGEIIKKGAHSLANNIKKNRFEIEIEKQIDEYIKTEHIEDSLENPLITPATKLAKIKEEMKAEAKQPELSQYLESAFKILSLEGPQYLTEEQILEMNGDFTSASEQLNDLELNASFDENFKTLMHLSNSTIDSIVGIAVAKYNDKRFSESLSLYVLLATLIPENPEYWYRASISAHADKNFEVALRFYSAAFTLDSELIGAKIFSIDCYLKLDQLDHARAEYSEVKRMSERLELEDSWKEMLGELEKVI